MDSQKKEFVLSLQDLCKLKILLNVELFPLKSLAQLPQSMRYRIFRILPLFDRLHYDSQHDHQFLLDIFQLQDISKHTEKKQWGTSRILYGNTDNMKQRLIESLFTDFKKGLVEGCRVNLKEASQFLDCLSSDEDPILTQHVFDFIERCYPCIVISWSETLWPLREPGNLNEKPFENYLVIPSRFEEFLTINKPNKSSSNPFKIVVHKPQALISYCHLRGIPYPSNKLVVDTIMFMIFASLCWTTYVDIRDKAIQSSISEHTTVLPPAIPDPLPFNIYESIPWSSDISTTDTNQLADLSITSLSPSMVDQHRSDRVPCIDPTCLFLQDILSSVEHLDILSYGNYGLSPHEKIFDQFSIDIPSFIMHNIVSQENPSLKSIHIDGNVPLFADSFVTLDTVTAYLCGQADGPRYLQDDKGNRYSLMPPSKPYFIEKLIIAIIGFEHKFKRGFKFILECHTASISRNVRKIIKCQESTLESISLKEHIGFAHRSLEDFKIVNPEEYCSLLQTTFIDFIQFLQFKSLELDDSPDQICHPLVMAFLSTPATHEQYLAISLKPDARPVPKDWYLWCDIIPNLPESNFKYKSLNLKGKESQVIKHLLRFPNLSLKSFSLSTCHLSADSALPSTINIQCVTLHLENDTKFSSSKLNSFICKNPSLTTLVIQDCYDYNDIQFDILPALKKINNCLICLVKNQATLESIILEGTNHLLNPCTTPPQSSSLSHMQRPLISDDEEEYDMTEWFNPVLVSEVADYRTRDIIMLFCLIQKLDATLTLNMESIAFQDLSIDLMQSLVQAEIMIRKITLKGYLNKWKDEFSKITRILETDEEAPSCRYISRYLYRTKHYGY